MVASLFVFKQDIEFKKYLLGKYFKYMSYDLTRDNLLLKVERCLSVCLSVLLSLCPSVCLELTISVTAEPNGLFSSGIMETGPDFKLPPTQFLKRITKVV